MANKSQFLEFKGKPLVRYGNDIYYGNPTEKYIIKMSIKSTKTFQDIELTDKIIIQLIENNPDISQKKQIVKSSEKQGLYSAMDIAEVWLKRYLENK